MIRLHSTAKLRLYIFYFAIIFKKFEWWQTVAACPLYFGQTQRCRFASLPADGSNGAMQSPRADDCLSLGNSINRVLTHWFDLCVALQSSA